MTRVALLGPVQLTMDAVPSSSSMTLASASSMSMRQKASLMKASARSRSRHSSGDCFSTRRVEVGEGELHEPMPLIAWVRLTNVVTDMADKELLRCHTTRLTYW